MTQEETRELWELCGFKRISDDGWEDPEGRFYLNQPAFTLENLFRWVVPKLTRYDLWCGTTLVDGKIVQDKTHWALAQFHTSTNVVEAETAKEALAQACLKALREGK